MKAIQSLLLALLVSLKITITNASQDAKLDINEKETNKSLQNNRIISFPLMNHEQFVERHHRERRLKEGDAYNDDISEIQTPRRTSKILPHAELYQGIGTHYVDIWVGTPDAQRETVIVDTGSDLTAFPCDPCKDCGANYHTDNLFKDENSVSFHLQQCSECWLGKCKHADDFNFCGMHMGYAEGSSWSAYEAVDWVYIGGEHDKAEHRERQTRNLGNADTIAQSGGGLRNMQQDTESMEETFMEEAEEAEEEYEEEHENDKFWAKDYGFELNFGCQYKITGLFKTQLADGICGMENSERSFWKQMYKKGKIDKEAFSLCFIHSEKIERAGSHAGAVTLGGTNVGMHKSKMVYADMFDIDGWYGVTVNAIYLKSPENSRRLDDGDSEEANSNTTKSLPSNIQKLELNLGATNREGVIVDSGTTESYFSSSISAPFKTAFRELMGFEFHPILPKREGETNPYTDYPTIVIQLKAAYSTTDDELMDSSGNSLPGLANSLDLDHPNDILLEIPPKQYMLWSAKSKVYSNRFHMDETSNYMVIGANAMTGHDIMFDVEKRRLGLALSDCKFEA